MVLCEKRNDLSVFAMEFCIFHTKLLIMCCGVERMVWFWCSFSWIFSVTTVLGFRVALLDDGVKEEDYAAFILYFMVKFF